MPIENVGGGGRLDAPTESARPQFEWNFRTCSGPRETSDVPVPFQGKILGFRKKHPFQWFKEGVGTWGGSGETEVKIDFGYLRHGSIWAPPHVTPPSSFTAVHGAFTAAVSYCFS